MRTEEFIHLHLHSEHSKFDGVSKVKALVAKAASLGMPAMALTDHGAVSGLAELHDECHKAGLLPLLGVEAYMADDVEIRTRQKRRHLCLIAINQTGYQNLVKLATLSAMFFFYKPLLDINLLARFNEGIVCTTACLGGWCAQPFFSETGYEGCGSPEIGARAFYQLREVFGDRLYLEIQPYDSPSQHAFNEWAMRQAETDPTVRLVATNDVHYVEPEDAEFQRYAILSGVRRWTDKGDGYSDMVERYVNKPEGHHLRTRIEMWDAFGRLHGAGVWRRPAFLSAMRAPWEVFMRASAVRFDTEVKIPLYRGETDEQRVLA